MMQTQRPTYEEIALSMTGFTHWISPSELHGLIIGTFCAKGLDLPEPLLMTQLRLTPETDVLSAPEQALLDVLLASTRDDLKTFNFEIELLLPTQGDVYMQASEFIHWCQGFMMGFDLNHQRRLKDADAIEAVKRIGEAAQIPLNELDISAQDEAYLTEVTEYVRLAILTIYADLHAVDNGSSPDLSTIH